MLRLFFLPAALLAASAPVSAFDIRGELGLESRSFFLEPLDERQTRGDGSLRGQVELYESWNDRDTSVLFVPFGRADSADEERTHWDIREAYLRHRFGDFEARAGIRRVFWGATESAHLVDVINQTDGVENPDGEDKLGQPMVNLAWTRSGHTVDLFALPLFRERTFPGVEGRLRPVVPVSPPFPEGTPPAFVSNDEAVYESSDEDAHFDWAVRYAYAGGDFDLGLSHFSGTARTPRLGPGGIVNTDDGPALVPYYELIERSGLDLTVVAGGWLLKLEGVYQDSEIETFSAAAGGFEYTLFDLLGSGFDIGLIAEYLWDERGDDSPQPFEDDVFVGARLAANDVASSELLAGVVVDADTQAMFVNVEGSRRLGDAFKLTLEARLFEKAEPDDPSYVFRNDDYLSLDLTWYF